MEKLNGEALRKIDEIVARHKDQAGPCIEMLHEVQNELGYIPFEAMEKIAEATGSSPAEVYGVVMFYAQFTTEPKGKHVINVCLGTACYVKGAQQLIDRVEKLTGTGSITAMPWSTMISRTRSEESCVRRRKRGQMHERENYNIESSPRCP